MLKPALTLLSLIISSLPLTTFAVPFAPYVDITLNTYWDSQYQDMEPADLTKISQASQVKNFRLAFINDSGNCSPAWGGMNEMSVTNAWGKHLTSRMLEQGLAFTISFGGAAGTDLSSTCTPDNLVGALEDVISTYTPKGLDFDIENGTADVPKLMAAIKNIEKTHPNLAISLTLPVMPEGLMPREQSVLKEAKSADIKYAVNLMAMDFGAAYTDSMGKYAILALTNTFLFLQTLYPEKAPVDLWGMLQVTPMIGVNDVNVEQFTLMDADLVRNFAKEKQIGAMSMWSLTRDLPCPDKWASPICSGANLQSKSYDFSKRFLAQ